MFQNINQNNQYKNLVNGEWKESSTKNYISISSPLKEDIIGVVPSMSQSEVDEVMLAAKSAQLQWKKTPVFERSQILYEAARLLLEFKDTLSDVMMLEIGKDRKSCQSEIIRTADFIKYTADSAKTMFGESISGDYFKGYQPNNKAMVSREALGVVLAISPFNYPINLAASKIAPALMMGNSVVFKPATQGSLCGLHLARIFELAGVPAGVLNTVTGRGSEIGDYIISHPVVNFINFTGSTEVGQRISQISRMVPLLMELGGKDAAIVLEDADITLTAKHIVDGAFSYSGQRCTAVKRVIVINSIADRLIAEISANMERLIVGNPMDQEKVDVVPLIQKKSADFVSALIKDAKVKGAKILKGGEQAGNLIQPTLIDFVTKEMRIAWEEPFGPVLPILRVSDVNEAIELANASEYGLQSSVFTKDLNAAFLIADSLEVGTVHINHKTERGPDHFPFLGTKNSGVGTQGIRYSLEAMSRPKATVFHIQ